MHTVQVLALVLAAGAGGDAAELSRLRAPLESYLSRIEAIRIRYVETWEPEPTALRSRKRPGEAEFPGELTPEVARRMEEYRKKAAQRGEPTTVSTHDLLDEFPSFRHIYETRSKYANGEETRQTTQQYGHDGKLLTLHSESKTAQSNPLDRAFLQLRSPLNVVGYRLPMTMNMRASELLAFPEITEMMPAEKVGEFLAVVVKVGPGLPKEIRNNPLANDEMWYQFWLDATRQYLPLRTDIYIENQYQGKPGFRQDQGLAIHRLPGSDGREHEFLRYRLEIQEFMDAPGRLRKDRVPFPKRASFNDAGGTIHWEVISVEINPAITKSDFQPTIPSDYAVVENGDVGGRRIEGGKQGRQQRLDEAAQKAREEVAKVTPPRAEPESFRIGWRLAAPVAIAVIVVLLFIVRSRNP